MTHVDDFCWRGTENFRDSIIRPLINIFSIGTEFEQIFRYLGLTAKLQHHVRSNPVHQ